MELDWWFVVDVAGLEATWSLLLHGDQPWTELWRCTIGILLPGSSPHCGKQVFYWAKRLPCWHSLTIFLYFLQHLSSSPLVSGLSRHSSTVCLVKVAPTVARPTGSTSRTWMISESTDGALTMAPLYLSPSQTGTNTSRVDSCKSFVC